MQFDSVAEKLFFNTVKITTWTATGDEGSGTGFFFEALHDGQAVPLIVTNKHVVDGTVRATMVFHRNDGGKPALGETLKVEFDAEAWTGIWVGHPDPTIDITVCAFQPMVQALLDTHGVSPFCAFVKYENIPSAETLAELDALESVTFVGYPNGIWDSKNFLPVARRGTTASPLQVNFEGTPRFLIDASVFGGSSGSPVFIADSGSYSTKSGSLVAGSRFYFLGVIAAVFYRTQYNEIVPVPIPTAIKTMTAQQEMLDLGVVFKASTVVETAEAFIQRIIEANKRKPQFSYKPRLHGLP
ncbi:MULTISPECIES: serine protease [unclassified Pseudomonas]|uniref:S1 family peptidase n=1 Tax=unclassified Pseudomonas TaxID=196821 RepID=UPI001FAF498A|nr:MULTISPECIES: serine protease [unclassified Pseudomonas]